MVTGAAGEAARGLFGARIFLVMSVGYLMSYGLRAINATIAPELSQELRLSNTSLGTLTSAYFVGFTAMQLPLGVLLDRYGPRRVNAILMAVAGAACAITSVAASLEALWVARLMIGVGFAAGLMAPFAMFRLWFGKDQQMRLAAWILMMGTLGVMVATAPVRWAIPMIGWRGVFVVCAIVLGIVALMMWFGLPRAREPAGTAHPGFLRAFAGYGDILASPFFWRMAMVSATVQGTFISVQTLWLGPWFVRVLGYTPERAAEALFIVNGILLFAYLLNGWIAPRLGTAMSSVIRLVAFAVPLNVLTLLAVVCWPGVAGFAGWLVLAVLTTIYTPVQARVGIAFPARIGGRALTAFNLVVFTSVILIQSIIGIVVDALIAVGWSQIDGFRAAIGLLAGLQAAAWLRFVTWRAAREPVAY